MEIPYDSPSGEILKWINDEKKRLKITDEQISSVIGIDRAQVHRMRNGKRPIFYNDVVQMAHLFGSVPPEFRDASRFTHDCVTIPASNQ